MFPVYGPIGAIGFVISLFITAWRVEPVGMTVLTVLILINPAVWAARNVWLVASVALRHPVTLWRRYRAARKGWVQR